MSEEHLARPFQRYIVCWYRITLSLLGGDLRFYRVMVGVSFILAHGRPCAILGYTSARQW